MTDQPPPEAGRLTPDELDELLGASGTESPGTSDRPAAGSVAADRLTGGSDEPSTSERVAAAARRHPLRAVAATALLTLSVGGAAAYLATRPPPMQTTIEATVVFGRGFDGQSGDALTAGEVVRTEITLASPPDAPPVRALALRGPGLSDARVQQRGSWVQTSNRLDCALLPDLSAEGPYLLQVAQTDAWGREITADVPLTEHAALDVRQRVRDAARAAATACRAVAADRLQLLDLRYAGAPDGSTTGAAAALYLTVHNPTAHDLWVPWAYAPFGSDGTTLTAGAAPAALPAGSTSRLALAATVEDCRRRPTYDRGAETFEAPGRRAGNFLLAVDAARVLAEPTYSFEGTALLLTEPQRHLVWRAITQACDGAPRVRYSLTGIRSATTGSPTVRLTLQAEVAHGSLDLRPGPTEHDPGVAQPPGAGTAMELYPGAASGPGATSSIRLRLDVQDCVRVPGDGPPSYRAIVHRGEQQFPYLLPLRSMPLLRALARICQVPVEDIAYGGRGWVAADGPT